MLRRVLSSALIHCSLRRCINATVFTRRCKMTSSPINVAQLGALKPLVGVVQMTSTPDKEATFAQLTALVERAKARGAQMIFVPECADYVETTKELSVAAAEPLNGDLVCRYKKLAARLNVWLSIGSFHERPTNFDTVKKIYNTHLIIDGVGSIQGIYRKIHLFDVDLPGGIQLRESAHTLPGDVIGPPVDTPVGSVGLAICYDLRFPELGVSLARQGAQVLTYPSAFMVPTGMAHWDALLRARAIENQCYVIAAAQVGRHHAKRESYGNAMIVDAWGKIIARCHDTQDVCLAEIDLSLLAKARQDIPIRNHKRYDLYNLSPGPSAITPVTPDVEYRFGPHTLKGSEIFYATPGRTIAFVNIKPVVPGHVLISPVRVVKHLADLTPTEVSDLFLTVQQVSGVVQRHYGATSVTVAVQDGPDAGQTVPHVHVHVLPRKTGDFEKNDDIYKRLEEHDKDVGGLLRRSEEVMAEEAKLLREYFK